MLAQTTLRDRFGQGRLRDTLRHLPGAHNQKSHGRSIGTAGLSEDGARRFRQSVEDVEAEFPSLSSAVVHWGTFEDETSRAIYSDHLRQSAADLRARGVDRPAAVREQLIKDVEGGMPLRDAMALEATNGLADTSTTSIVGMTVDVGNGKSAVLIDPSLETQRSLAQSEMVNLPFTKPMEQTIYHESGHALMRDIESRHGGKTAPNGQNVDDMVRQVDASGASFSEYGSLSGEGFAEVAAAHLAGGTAGPSTSPLWELVDQVSKLDNP